MYSQLNAGVGIIRGYNFDLRLRNWGYNAAIGCMIKKRINIAVEYEHTNMAIAFYVNYIDYSIHSTQLKIQYYIVPVKYTFNPYIEVGTGVFKRIHQRSLTYPHYVSNAYGASVAFGALFRVHKKIAGLYINGKLKYQHVGYVNNQTKCINAEVGVFYLLSFLNKEVIKNTR